MEILVRLLGFVLLAQALMLSCQQGKKKEAEAPRLVSITKTTFIGGDSIPLQFSQPLTKVRVGWDGKPLAARPAINNTVIVSSTGQSVGLHHLVVSGATADNKTVSDTVEIELWSDIKPTSLSYTVQQTYPHQSSSFTQGLEFYKGTLYEGTGLNGQSSLLKVDVKSGAILQSMPLANEFFGEGITIVNNRIYQLTWTSGQCFQYNMNMVRQKTFRYHTQGWGLTHRDTTLILSDGSNRLFFYTPQFVQTGELAVYDNQGPVMNLNELEYVNGYVLANVWKTNRIIQIDLASGKVVGQMIIDPGLAAGADPKEDVRNGIVYKPGDSNNLYITGKNWPRLYRIDVKGLSKGPKGAGTIARR